MSIRSRAAERMTRRGNILLLLSRVVYARVCVRERVRNVVTTSFLVGPEAKNGEKKNINTFIQLCKACVCLRRSGLPACVFVFFFIKCFWFTRSRWRRRRLSAMYMGAAVRVVAARSDGSNGLWRPYTRS